MEGCAVGEALQVEEGEGQCGEVTESDWVWIFVPGLAGCMSLSKEVTFLTFTSVKGVCGPHTASVLLVHTIILLCVMKSTSGTQL